MRLLMATTARTRGQSLVELAVVSPLLLMMILSMVDFALAFNTNIMIRNAVAEGGYYAAQNPGDDAGIRGQILHELRNLNPAVTNADITVTACVARTTGPETEIAVAYDYPLLFGLFGWGPTIELENSTTVPQFGGCN
jgi:Flp pilus assembly protein TadG